MGWTLSQVSFAQNNWLLPLRLPRSIFSSSSPPSSILLLRRPPTPPRNTAAGTVKPRETSFAFFSSSSRHVSLTDPPSSSFPCLGPVDSVLFPGRCEKVSRLQPAVCVCCLGFCFIPPWPTSPVPSPCLAKNKASAAESAAAPLPPSRDFRLHLCFLNAVTHSLVCMPRRTASAFSRVPVLQASIVLRYSSPPHYRLDT